MGYEAGADDYITKPFSLSVLLLKIEAYFRRRQEKTEAGQMISGDIVFIAGEMKVLIKSREISLTKTELKMLTFFFRIRNRFFQKHKYWKMCLIWKVILWMKIQSLSISEDSVRKLRQSGCTGLYKEYQRTWIYMESGGKAVTKRYHRKLTSALSLVLPVILVFAILNCFTTYVFYEDYNIK